MTYMTIPSTISGGPSIFQVRMGTGDILSATNRYAVLYRIHDAKRPETRARRIEAFVAMLARGETIYAQRKTLSG